MIPGQVSISGREANLGLKKIDSGSKKNLQRAFELPNFLIIEPRLSCLAVSLHGTILRKQMV